MILQQQNYATVMPTFYNLNRFHYITIGIIITILFLFSLKRPKSNPDLIELELESLPTTNFNPLRFPNATQTKLFNLTLKYILTPTPCPKPETLAVIIVTSHLNNVETRSAMRRAFPGEKLSNLGLKRVFLLGESPAIYITQSAIVDESRRFGDILQGNFKEAYRNLTYKHLMGLKWVSENCQSTKYVIKMDDDIVINVGKTVKLLQNLTLPGNTIAGYVLRDLTPKRDPANKWYVTQEEYKYGKYPTFVSGWFYVTRVNVAARLVELSRYFRYFWIDDVFITGILAANLKMKLIDLRRYFIVFPEFLQCCINDVRKNLDCDILVGPNGGDNNLFLEFNKAMQVCEGGKCGVRVKPINQTCVAERKINLPRGNGVIENYNLH